MSNMDKKEYDRQYQIKNRERRRAVRADYNKTPQGLYQIQKQNARRRGIPWEFDFDSWFSIWEPVLEERGRGVGKLCMARYGDEGPYSPDNVKLITHGENVAESNRRVAS